MGTLAVAFRFCVLILTTPAQGAAAPPPEKDMPGPTLVTAATSADAESLAELEKPGRVFFREDFEARNALDKYFEVNGKKEGFAFLTRAAQFAHSGVGVFRCTAIDNDGKSSGAGLNHWFGQPRRENNAEVDPGYERVYFRYYIKWDKDYDQGQFNHTGGSLSAIAGTNKWLGMGTAGKRPKGDDYCSTRFEATVDWKRHPPPGAMFSYTYWMDMKADKDGNYWGSLLWPKDDARFLPEPGVWYCMEQMIKLNSFENDLPLADGELATWIDGKLYTHFTGIRWRSSPAVRLKRCGVGVYVHKSVKENTVWYDDLALSTGYIGPIPDAKPKTDTRPKAEPAKSSDPILERAPKSDAAR